MDGIIEIWYVWIEVNYEMLLWVLDCVVMVLLLLVIDEMVFECLRREFDKSKLFEEVCGVE